MLIICYNTHIVKKKQNQPKRIENRRARHDYALGDSFVVGIVLNGGETKALRMGQGQLRGAYVTIKDNELWLVNATITGTTQVRVEEAEQTRSRKLLAKRREIDVMQAAKNQGNTIVPTEILTSGRFIKLRIAVGKGKQLYDKRDTLKKRDETRRIQMEMKRH